ncbi:hypothetical protein [Lacticaseibacillus paracasei]|uniref:hypothetical protein n=1 Tax=Lacticaseibacillus paracasei TaxID=1597 RepID=UPI001038BB7B|nr:hypothetical protein [Lacticaseibacillus paracasei]
MLIKKVLHHEDARDATLFIYMDHDPLQRQTPSWGLNPHLDMNDTDHQMKFLAIIQRSLT